MRYSHMPMKFGKYKGVQIGKVPKAYLRWCIENDVLSGKQLVYAKTELNFPKDEYLVTIEYSVAQDGTYHVLAYSTKDAIRVAKSMYNIRGTQSHCGTEYTVTRLTY